MTAEKKLNIVIDENIPYAEALFSTFGNLSALKGRDICAKDVENADILLVRSVTKVNQGLLENSNVKFVGTCTIGVDHLDTSWLDQNGIAWASAPGCNALGVVQYVMSCLAKLNVLHSKMNVAIVGCGNVGGKVYQYLKAFGKNCFCIDPFKTLEEIEDLRDFEKIYDCDLICLHTPLTRKGPFATHHLINKNVLERLKPGAILLNAGRGAVINNNDLFEFLRLGGDLNVVLDVWETEPDIKTDLLGYVRIATAHIAGYSFEGKVNGSLMIFDALVKYLQKFDVGLIDKVAGLGERVVKEAFGEQETLFSKRLKDAILEAYDVSDDDRLLRAAVDELPGSFDALRKNYAKRREFSHFRLLNLNSQDYTQAKCLGFGSG